MNGDSGGDGLVHRAGVFAGEVWSTSVAAMWSSVPRAEPDLSGTV